MFAQHLELKMVKVTRETVVRAPQGQKPTRYRFRGDMRIGFRRNRVVEIVKFNGMRRNATKN
jgi:hypothetical protein